MTLTTGLRLQRPCLPSELSLQRDKPVGELPSQAPFTRPTSFSLPPQPSHHCSLFVVHGCRRTKNQEPATNNAFHLLPPRLGSSLTPLPPGSCGAPLGLRLHRSLPHRSPAAWFIIDGTLLPQSGAAPLGLFATLSVFRACSHRLGSSFNPHPS